MTPEELFKDPDFIGLPQGEKLKVLTEIDPDFAKLPGGEQIKVISGFNAQPTQTPPAKPGLMMGGKPVPDYMRWGAMSGAEAVGMPAGEMATEYAPEIGLIGGGLLGAGPLSPVTAGMGYAAGHMVKGALKGQAPTTPVEDVSNLGIGAALDLGGQAVSKIATKLFAPAAGKITEGLKSGINWLESKGLPFSADVAGTARLSQKIADWMGFGRFYTNSQRAKLAEGLTETVGDISKEIGIPVNMTPSETGTAVADFLQQVTQKGPYYENFNNLVKGIPETKWSNTLDAIKAIGGRIEGVDKEGFDLAYKEGLKNLRNVYTGKKGKALIGEIESLIAKDGVMTGEEAASLINQLWTATKYSNLPGAGKELIGRVKEGFMSDMESFAVPGTTDTLATIRAAADKATHEALKWIENSPVTGKFLRVQLQGPRKVYLPKWEGHIAEGLPTMITNVTKDDVLGLKQRMVEAGQPELWEATKLAYLQKVFDSTVKNGQFDPKKYLTWYNQYGNVASEVMPELSGNLAQWANISSTVGKDFSRMKGNQLAGSLGIGMALGGMEALRSGDYTKLVSVPAAFSLIAAAGTMSGSLGFLRKWALKETSLIAAPMAGIAAEIGASRLRENDNAVLPGSDLSFGSGMGVR